MRIKQNAKYLYHSGDCLEVRPLVSKMQFIFQLFNAPVVRRLDMFNLNGNMEKIVSMLDSKKAEIIRERYGFQNGTMMNFRETGEIVGLTKQRVQVAEESAFEKMAEQRGIFLAPQKSLKPHRIGGNYIEQLFVDDLYRYVNGEKTMLLDKIFQTSGVQLEISSEVKEKPVFSSNILKNGEKSMQLLYQPISEMGLSVSLAKSLSETKFTKLGEILLLPEKELHRFLDDSQVKELHQKIAEVRYRIAIGENQHDGFYTIVTVNLNYQGTSRKIQGYLEGKTPDMYLIVNMIYEILCDHEVGGANVFEADFPMMMTNCLLLNGYFYIRDVFKNFRHVSLYFENTDMTDYADILRGLIKNYSATISLIDDEIASFMKKYHIETLSQLQHLSKKEMNPEHQQIAECLEKWCSLNILEQFGENFGEDVLLTKENES